MMTFIAVCVGLITVEFGIVAAFLIVTFLQLRRTARAVEVLAYQIEDQVSYIGATLKSGWWQTILSFVGGWWTGRKR